MNGDAHRLLTAVLPAPHPSERLNGRYLLPGTRRMVSRFYPTVDALLRAAERYRSTHHTYYTVGLRLGEDGTKDGVTRSGTSYADVDAKLWGDDRGATLAAIDGFTPRPSAVVDSGGGLQPYWFFTEPLEVQGSDLREQVEALNRALAWAVCGQSRRPDAVQDVSRVLRLPGSLNLKYDPPRPVRLLWCEPERRYPFAELVALVRRKYPWAWRPAGKQRAAPVVSVPAVDRPTSDLCERAAQGRIRQRTLALLDSTGADGYRSASEADAAIAAGLIASGLTDGEALAVLLGSPRGCDGLARKGERHGRAYWERTVARAAAYVGPVVLHAGGRRARRLPPLGRPVGTPLPPLGRPT